MHIPRQYALVCLVLLLTACGAAPAPIGSTLYPPTPERLPEPTEAKPAEVPDDIVARSAQSFRGQRNADGQALDQAQLLDELSKFDVVCLGEAHDSRSFRSARVWSAEHAFRAERSGSASRCFRSPTAPHCTPTARATWTTRACASALNTTLAGATRTPTTARYWPSAAPTAYR